MALLNLCFESWSCIEFIDKGLMLPSVLVTIVANYVSVSHTLVFLLLHSCSPWITILNLRSPSSCLLVFFVAENPWVVTESVIDVWVPCFRICQVTWCRCCWVSHCLYCLEGRCNSGFGAPAVAAAAATAAAANVGFSCFFFVAVWNAGGLCWNKFTGKQHWWLNPANQTHSIIVHSIIHP